MGRQQRADGRHPAALAVPHPDPRRLDDARVMSTPISPPTAVLPDPPAQQRRLAASTPLLLLPVNVQTRFMDTAGSPSELWVRIYPDAIAIDPHDPKLTGQEVTDGTAYWDAVWRAGKPTPPSDAEKAPWRGPPARAGARRAGRIRRPMHPP